MHLLNTAPIRISPPLVNALENAVDPEQQISILSSIKNEIAGHEIKKIEYICAGLIPCIAEKLSELDLDSSQSDSNIDQIWRQVAQITCLINNGGPQFTEPILYSDLIRHLLEKLATGTSGKLSIAILQCLNAIADNLPLATRDDWTPDRRLAQHLYTTRNACCLTTIILDTGPQVSAQQICDAVLSLICKTCLEERHKAILIDAGLLSTLCRRLSTFLITERFNLPVGNDESNGLLEFEPFLNPAPRSAQLSPVLETISCLIENSRTNTEAFIHDPVLSSVLDRAVSILIPSDIQKPAWGSGADTGLRFRNSSPLDFLLPFAPDSDRLSAAENSSFPPLGSALPNPKRRTSSVRAISEYSSGGLSHEDMNEKDETLIVPWLLYLVRTYRMKKRLVAARLLVLLQKHNFVRHTRKRSFASLLIPVLVQMLDFDTTQHNTPDETTLLSNKMSFWQMAPGIMAQCVMDDEFLQKAAVDAKAIPKLVMALKANFELSDDSKDTLWWPKKGTKTTMTPSQTSSLGYGGPTLKARHSMNFREGLLQAVAAIAPTNDRYRKDICEHGALNQIMLALEPFQGLITASPGGDWIAMSGNSAPTLLAACGTVRALTRSVTSLRTKLVDADVGKAVLKLMNAPDPEVRIAATKVVCNLLLDFSPIKQTISESSLIKKLCEQAHSANAQLRYESLWALKTMVYKSPNKLKKEVVDELGPSWIRHLLATDPHDIPPGEVIGLVEREYPKGSFARLTTDGSDDVDMDDAGDQKQDLTELTFNRHTLNDDIKIQEQLLGFLSNLFCGEQCAEIVEYLLNEIGAEEFIFIMLERLRSRIYSGPTRRGNQTSSVPIGIVYTTILVITHVAAAGDKFKSMVISNTTLLKQLATFLTHQESTIRSQCCWLAINLMFREKDGDSDNILKLRAVELQKAGFHNHIRRLESNDPDMDVKERAKSAMLLFNSYLKS